MTICTHHATTDGHKVTERVSNGEASRRNGRPILEESRSCGTRNDEETLHITVGVEPKKKSCADYDGSQGHFGHLRKF